MTRHDSLRLKTLIERHRRFTASIRAQQILDDWVEYLPKFVKVMPIEYRAALQQMHAAAQPGDPVELRWNVGA